MAGLQQKIHRLQSVNRVDDGSVIPGCCPEVNRLLPGGGYRRGTIIEWIVTGNSSSGPSSQPKNAWQSGGYGVDYLSLLAAGRACNDGGALVVIDSERNFYPPAAVAAGIDLHNLIVLRPPSSRAVHPLARSSGLRPPTSHSFPDHNAFYWAIDQALKCSAVAAVWGPVAEIDERWFRRFQLSAESSGVTGMFIRPPAAAGRPGWSEVQWRLKKRRAEAGNNERAEAGDRNAQAEQNGREIRSSAAHPFARSSDLRPPASHFPAAHSFSLNLRLAAQSLGRNRTENTT